jgi:hypothetical protein
MMKAVAVLLFLLAASSLFAAQYDETPFVPLDPEVMGRGGSAVADAHGWESFFFNPAGYSRGGGVFALTSTSVWLHARPDQFMNVLVGPKTQTDILDFLNDQVTTGGFGMGASTGIGYVGNGLGLGFVVMADSMMYGPTLLGLTGDLTTTVGFIGGLAVPFDVGGFKIHVGGDVRPMIRMHTLLSNADAIAVLTALSTGGSVMGAMNASNTVYGVGFALDAGVIAELGWFTVGLTIRDLGGTQFTYNENTFGNVTSSLGGSLKFPPGTAVTDKYVIPMDIALGGSFHPDLGTVTEYVDPSINLDIHDLAGIIGGTKSFWTLVHAGVGARLIGLFDLALGLDTGYLTFGAGVHLVVFDMSFALYTQELGAHIGDRPSSGASINLSVRW